MAGSGWWERENDRINLVRLIFCTVIGLESDVLMRVFLLVPGQTYWLFYGFTVEQLQLIWLGAGIITPIKVFLAVILMATVGYQVLRALPKYIIHSKESTDLVLQEQK
jgi:hypothetical protein